MREHDLTTPDAFRAWLTRQDPTAIVGQAARTDCCPLQHWLGCDEVTESTAYYGTLFATAHPPVELPPWAKQFIARLDDAFGFATPITAAAALRILADVEVPHA